MILKILQICILQDTIRDMEIEVELYETPSGKCPFDDWFENLREAHTRAKILTRLDRLRVGNFGDCKAIGEGWPNFGLITAQGYGFTIPRSATR
jgi:putative component of toxin-antitoxin plasmid stabilization module